MLNNKNILVTGGTGSIGESLIHSIIEGYSPKTIRIFSRDETKQHKMSKKFKEHLDIVRFLIGDVRDKERLNRAMQDIDIVL